LALLTWALNGSESGQRRSFVAKLNWTQQSSAIPSDVGAPNAQMQRYYQEIFHMRVYPARAQMAQETMQDGFLAYLNSYADMVELMSLENRAAYDDFLEQQAVRQEVLEKLDENSPYSRFLRAEVRLHTAFVKLKFGHEVKGAWDIIKAFRMLSENAKKFPQFVPNQKSLGLLHVLIGATPDQYSWVLGVLGLKGNIKLGMSELANASRQETLWQTESQLITHLVKLFVRRASTEELSAFEQFVQKNQDNQLILFFGTSALTKEGRAETAWNLLETRPATKGLLPLPFLEYQKAEILLMKAQYPQAIASYQRFLGQHKGFNFVKDTYFKLFLAHWLDGQGGKGKVFLQKINQVGASIVEADKAAQKFKENESILGSAQQTLMKARLACDGGYYDLALGHLQGLTEGQLPQDRDRAELFYRRGRIVQRMGRPDEAMPFFERAMTLCQDKPWSFGASSALQMGYIWVEKKQKDKAKIYFEKALSFKKHEYKNSIDNKARAALGEL
jgi:tetratricopeptide (TPR) repeat protein